MTTTKEIRTLIIGAANQLSFLMRHGKVVRDISRYNSIERLRAQFSSYSNATLSAHYRWVVVLQGDVMNIIPPYSSRYKTARKKLIALIDEAKTSLSGDNR